MTSFLDSSRTSSTSAKCRRAYLHTAALIYHPLLSHRARIHLAYTHLFHPLPPAAMASSLKKVLSKVVSHTRSSSKASSRDSLNGGAHPLTNGKIEKTAKPSVEIDDTNAKGETAARKQQAKDAANGLPRPSTNSERPLSFTEQKEDREAEREAKDDEEAKARKERMQKLHEEVSACTGLQSLCGILTWSTGPATRQLGRSSIEHVANPSRYVTYDLGVRAVSRN